MEAAEALKLGRVFLTPTPSMLSFSPLVQPPLPPPISSLRSHPLLLSVPYLDDIHIDRFPM